LPAQERTALLTTLVRAHAATVLGHPDAEAIGRDRPFKDLGIDSLTAVELRNRLSSETGVRLATTVVFQYPSPVELAEHLATLLEPAAASGADEASATALAAAPAASPELIDEMDVEALIAMVKGEPAGAEGNPR
jgi:acyl carrier protein